MLLKLICHGKQKFKKCVNRRHRKKTALEQLGRSFNILGYLTLTANRSLAIGEFSSNQTVCTRTLYNYVDQGLMDSRNCDLPEKLKRNTKIHRIRINKRKLGRSIEERPQEINDRKEFGHWECDLVLGHKTRDDQVLLTLSERMSREFLEHFKNNTASTGTTSSRQSLLIMARSSRI